MTNQMNEDILQSPYNLQKAQKLSVKALNLLHSAGALMGCINQTLNDLYLKLASVYLTNNYGGAPFTAKWSGQP